MSMHFVTVSWPEVSVIVWPRSEGAKVIVSPLPAAASVARREPAPWSALFTTIKVLSRQRSSSDSTEGRLWNWNAGRPCVAGADRALRLRSQDAMFMKKSLRLSEAVHVEQ